MNRTSLRDVRVFLTLLSISAGAISVGSTLLHATPGDELADKRLDVIHGASKTTRQLIVANSTCSQQYAGAGGGAPYDWASCHSCVDVGPPVPCVKCDFTGQGDITQFVTNTGNYNITTDNMCGGQTLGGCIWWQPPVGNRVCICLNPVGNGGCAYYNDTGAVQ